MDLRNCDCMDLMQEFPDKFFDLAITSPPYNLNTRVRNGEYCSRQITKELSTKYKNYSDNLHPDRYFEWMHSVISEMMRVSNLVFFNIQQCTGNKKAIGWLLGAFANELKETIVWDKTTAEPSISDGCLNSEFEFIFVFQSNGINRALNRAFKEARFNRGTLSNVWRFSKARSSDPTHKASFPIDIPKTIIKNFGIAGQKVIDPFLGTGTTAIACYEMGFHITGSELDKDYFDAMQKRIKEETRQFDLFRTPHQPKENNGKLG